MFYFAMKTTTRLRKVHKVSGIGSSVTRDSTDYLGNVVIRNGHLGMYRFDGGYVSFSNDTINGWHFYISDYMGNNRMVVRDSIIEQITHYYPYGGLIGDISTLLSDVTKGNNENVQKYKLFHYIPREQARSEGPRSHQKEIDNLLARRRAFRRGVELDRTFGLDFYDIHARQYFAMMPSWDRIDPFAEFHFKGSPYMYCAGNPVNYGDYDGYDYWSTDNPDAIKQFLYEYSSGLGFCNYDFNGWQHTSDIDFINGLSYDDESNYYYLTLPFIDDDAFGIRCKIFSNKWYPSSESFIFSALEFTVGTKFKDLWNKQSASVKSPIAYDILQRFPYKVKTSPSVVYKTIIPNTIDKIGKGIGAIGAGISLYHFSSNISNNKTVGVGDALSFSFILFGLYASSSVTLPVCGIYTISDLVTYNLTGKTIDEHLNDKWHLDYPK